MAVKNAAKGTATAKAVVKKASDPVIATAKGDARFATALIDAIGWHRHWDRAPSPV